MIRLPECDADELLSGAKAIGKFIGKSEDAVQRLIASKLIPAFKVGGRWHMRKSTWREHVRRLEDDAAA